MAVDKNDLTDCTTDLFQVLNTIKWEANQLNKAKQKLEGAHTLLVIKVQSDKKPATATDVRNSIADAYKILDATIQRANLVKQYLKNLGELF